MSKLPKELTNSLRNQEEIKDPKMRALSNFTKIMLEKRGYPTKSDVADFTAAGYEEKHILEIILAIILHRAGVYLPQYQSGQLPENSQIYPAPLTQMILTIEKECQVFLH